MSSAAAALPCAPEFDAGFRKALRDLFVWRRDVRRFLRRPLPAGALERLLEVANLAPSVGLSQPWRFVVVEDAARLLRELQRRGLAGARRP